MGILDLKFTSGNSVPVNEVRLTRGEYEEIKAELAVLQARIDSIMLEYCPEDMDRKQIDTWGKFQKPMTFRHQDSLRPCLWEGLTSEERNKPMMLSCNCPKCSLSC